MEPLTAFSDSGGEERTVGFEGVHWYRVGVLFSGRDASRT